MYFLMNFAKFFRTKENVQVTASLTHFRRMFPFYTPWKHHKTRAFLIFSGGKETDH